MIEHNVLGKAEHLELLFNQILKIANISLSKEILFFLKTT